MGYFLYVLNTAFLGDFNHQFPGIKSPLFSDLLKYRVSLNQLILIHYHPIIRYGKKRLYPGRTGPGNNTDGSGGSNSSEGGITQFLGIRLVKNTSLEGGKRPLETGKLLRFLPGFKGSIYDQPNAQKLRNAT